MNRNRRPPIPHVCWTCDWFKSRKPHGGKVCQYPGKINVTETAPHQCLCWVEGDREQLEHPSFVDGE